MTRVEFRLSMPSAASWDGRWSGSGRRYAVIRTMTAQLASRLLNGADSASWTYSFNDGWVAQVTAREISKGQRVEKSDGFCGYDWMVESILTDGVIRAPQPRQQSEAT